MKHYVGTIKVIVAAEDKLHATEQLRDVLTNEAIIDYGFIKTGPNARAFFTEVKQEDVEELAQLRAQCVEDEKDATLDWSDDESIQTKAAEERMEQYEETFDKI
jgi:hypothetical protein